MRECPHRLVTPNVVEFLDLYDAFRDFGLPPVQGGSLQQCGVFVDACRLMRSWEPERK